MTREQLKALLPEGTTDEFAPAGLVRTCGLGSHLRAWIAPAGLVAPGSGRPPDVHSLPGEASPAPGSGRPFITG